MIKSELVIGSKYHRWTVVKLANETKYKSYLCRCDCGVIKPVIAATLIENRSKSCGCYRVGLSRAFNGTGYKKRTPEQRKVYSAWYLMMHRCFSPKSKKYNSYGARGITVCNRWHSIENFSQDMGPKPSSKHSLDRINGDGDYEPGNCRWATIYEQNNNTSRNVKITYQGDIKTISEWARYFGMDIWVFGKRIRRGWDIFKAGTLPIKTQKAPQLAASKP